MSLLINTNIASLGAQRQLSSSGMQLDRATERLSSGQRINSAKDDAAGLAIANKMTSTIKGLDQAIRNANDGVSLIQTAEGALNETTNILQRMRELAVQSSNGIYSNADRKTLDAENKQLVSELDRISSTTSFNGQNLLDGKLGTVKLQVGADANQTISLKISAMDAKSLGLGATASDMGGTHMDQALTATTFKDGDVLINGQSIGAFDGGATPPDTLSTLVNNINSKVSGVTAKAFNEIVATSVGLGDTTDNDLVIDIGNPDGSSNQFTIKDTTNLDELVSAINTQSNGALVASKTADGKFTMSSATGGTIMMTSATLDADVGTGFTTATAVQSQIGLSSADGSSIKITTGSNAASGILANLGFQETRTNGSVQGVALDATTSIAALATGDLKINGTSISATGTTTLQGKVNNINAVSETTGVTAVLKAESTTKYDGAKVSAEVTGGAQGAAAAATDNILINGTAVLAGANIAAFVVNVNAQTANTGVTAYVDSAAKLHLFSESAIKIATGTVNAGAVETAYGVTAAVTATSAPSTGSLRLNNTSIALTDLTDINIVKSEINAKQSDTGVFASINDQGQMVLNSTASFSIEVGDTNGAKTLKAFGLSTVAGGAAGSAALSGVSGAAGGVQLVGAAIQLTSTNKTPITIDATADGLTNTGLLSQNQTASGAGFGSSVSSISIATQDGAQKALKIIDTALTTVNDTRASLGAVNNRLDFTVANLTSTSEKTTAARSRIMDADFAAETSALSRSQVLQQAAQAMLAQSNQRPQQVMSLLR